MNRAVLYVAAPLAPTENELADVEFVSGVVVDANPHRPELRHRIALRRNIERAMRWLSWLRRSFPETTFIAPWIASVQPGEDDSDPAQREAGLVDACSVIERCDGIVLCGGRVSSGMRREMEHGEAYMDAGEKYGCGCRSWRFDVYDLTPFCDEPSGIPPSAGPSAGMSFDYWVSAINHGRIG